jgi:hypothetical protein
MRERETGVGEEEPRERERERKGGRDKEAKLGIKLGVILGRFFATATA